jgi:tRNA U34 5-carboxymethylaminomethyl modifying GTPase MnmE/TrmE
MDLGGIPCIISDTAGLRSDSTDIIEQEGMRRAREAFKKAELKIFIGDASDQISLNEAEDMLQVLLKDLDADDDEIVSDEDYKVPSSGYRLLTVLNKADLVIPHKEGGCIVLVIYCWAVLLYLYLVSFVC